MFNHLIAAASTWPASSLRFVEDRLYFFSQQAPEISSVAVLMIGPLDLPLLEQSLSTVAHRSTIGPTSMKIQPVARSARDDLILVGQLPTIPAQELIDVVRRTIDTIARQPFDDHRCMRQGHLLQLAEDIHVLIVTMRQGLADTASLRQCIEEVAAVYEAAAIGAEIQETQSSVDHAEPYTFLLAPRLSMQLAAFSESSAVPLDTILLAAFEVLVHRYKIQDEIVVSVPQIWHTLTAQASTEFYVDPSDHWLVVPDYLSFKAFVTRVAQQDRVAHADGQLSRADFDAKVAHGWLEQAKQPMPAAQFRFCFWNEASSTSLPGQIVPDLGRTSAFSLTMSTIEHTLKGQIRYHPEVLDYTTVERIAGHFQALLESIVMNPDERIAYLRLLTKAEHQQSLIDWNRSEADYPRASAVHELIEAQAERNPETPAIVFEGASLTYAELNARANQLAHYLRAQGVGPDVLVALCVERSLEMIVGMLAILKAGGAYVPLDPAYPADRLQYMLSHSQAPVILTHAALVERLPKHQAQVFRLDADWDTLTAQPTTNLPRTVLPDHLAYIIFTSGSTGRPKGVMVKQQGLINLVYGLRAYFDDPAVTITGLITSISFDISVNQIFPTLIFGRTLHIISDPVKFNSRALVRYLDEHRIHLLDAVPSYLQAVLNEVAPEQPANALRYLLIGGEKVEQRLLHSIFGQFGPQVEVVNIYGLTEISDINILGKIGVADVDQPITVGKPLQNNRIYIVDAFDQPQPIGIAGEVCVSGESVSRGYLFRPELTADRFVVCPFEDGQIMVRTGDLGRWRDDGTVEILGRIDHQVKIRGFRIETGEIEAVLAKHPSVNECVVVAREDVPGDKRLVGYVALRENMPAATTSELRQLLGAQLPEYMVPTAFVTLTMLPKTPNGKIDRKALPAPDMSRPDLDDSFVAPSNPMEELVAGIWAEVLHLERIGIHDDFFALGGHSLLATQVISRVRALLHIDLPVHTLFTAPTVAGLATTLVTYQQPSNVQSLPITHVPRDGKLPLSFAQQRLWFLDQLDPGTYTYNIPLTIRLTGSLHVDALAQALNEIVRRHESLRSVIVSENGQPFQQIRPVLELALPLVDLQPLPAAEREAAASDLALRESQTPFNLAQGPLARAQLLQLAAEDYLLLLTIHHIIADGWSIEVLFQELSASYAALVAGAAPSLPELPIQYVDFAHWQQEWLHGSIRETQLEYWRKQLGGSLPLLNLPTDRPRPMRQTFHGAQAIVEIDENLTAALEALSRREGVTLFMTLMSAFKILLHRYSGQTDLLVGSPIANRTRVETEHLIGFLINTLVLRTNLANNPTVRELLAQVRDVALAAYAHQDLPFEHLVELVQPERDLSHNPLFQVMFVLQNVPASAVHLPGLTWQRKDTFNGTAKFDLWFSLQQGPQGLHGVLEYNTDLFDASTIERLIGHFTMLLVAIVANPEQHVADIDMVSAAERAQIVERWNNTVQPYPSDRCLHQLVEEQAARTPDAVAVTFPAICSGKPADERLSYRELNERANQLAQRLHTLGVGPEARVGVCLERSIDMVIAILGTLKAGGVYVPLDPSYPQDRLAFMLADSQIVVLLTQERVASALPPHSATVLCLDAGWDQAPVPTQPLAAVTPDNLAYVIYTSGSTGRPKGVQIPHRAVVNFMTSMQRQPGIAASDTLLAVTTLSFDIAGLELFLPLTVGAQIVIASREVATDGSLLVATLQQTGTSLMQATPTTWRLLLEAGWPAELDLRVLCGGEALPRELAQSLTAHAPAVWNLYGPTETTVWSAAQRIEAGEETIPIGHPIANTQIYLLDRHLKLVPIGVPGELYIGGDGLSRGYHGRPDLTAERFIPDPFSQVPGARLYKTGDLARYRSDGMILYLGRTDHQVKVRGFRIELGEIEAVLAQHPAIRDAVVLVREDLPGQQRLVAYVVTSDRRFSLDNARHFMREHLPEYMIPTAVVVLDALPLTPNGKIDRNALPTPDIARHDLDESFVAPRTPLEELVAGIWSQVLQREQVGVHDHFFALGGHSLLATQVVARIRNTCGVQLAVRHLFEAPTVASLVTQIESLRRTTGLDQTPPLEPAGNTDLLPLSFGQQRLWLLDQINPGTTSYNIPNAVRLRGPLNTRVLEQAFAAVLDRHATLRTSFALHDDQPVQIIAPTPTLTLPSVDLSALPADMREPEAQRLMLQAAQQPFDLSHSPLLRAQLLRLHPEGTRQEHILQITFHHIIFDEWSLGVLVRDLASFYRAFIEAGDAAAADLPTLPVQYCDYAIWQRAWLQGQALAEQLAYWKQHLAGAPAVLALPTDRPRPAVQTFNGAEYYFTLPVPLSNAVKTFSQREGVTLFMTLLATFKILLARYSGQTHIVVGSPTAGRTRTELENLIGFFVNTLALHTDLSGNPSIRALLEQVREVSLGAYAHQDLPFEKLVEELRIPRSLSHAPLFQVLFDLHNVPVSDLDAAGVTFQPFELEGWASKFDLSLVMWERDGSLGGAVVYNTDLFETSTIARLVGHFHTLLAGMVADPQSRIWELPLLTQAEREDLLFQRNTTATAYPQEQCFQDLFEAQVKRTPDAVALQFADQQLTYAQLNAHANQLAHALRQRNVKPGGLVAICIERSLELVIGVLGILKAGSAYVPLDPTYPHERLQFMLTDSQAPMLLTQRHLRARLPEHSIEVIELDAEREQIAQGPSDDAHNAVTPAHIAYMIYTSGSTGRPKGTMIPHRGLVNYLSWATEAYNLSAGNGTPVHSPLGFDLTVTSLLAPLVAGQRVLMLPEDQPLDRLSTALKANAEFSLVKLTPVHVDVLNHELPAERLARSARALIIGGEALRADTVANWREHAPQTRLINEYGPTETVVGCCVYEVPPTGSLPNVLPIGRPIANTQIYILDRYLNPVPIGVPGELYVGGEGVSYGYYGRPDLTAERFIPDPFTQIPGARLYKTGDQAIYLADRAANIAFIGRFDNQIKLRGYRVELGEIDAVLTRHPQVREAVALVREDTPDDRRLVGYIVPENNQSPTARELADFLKDRLPEYMIPAAFIFIDTMPLGPHGKIDRTALPAPGAERPMLDAIYVAPRTPVEETLADIWKQVLKLDQIGAYDNFFALGGHSLLATQVMVRVRDTFQIDLPMRTIFETPSVAGLAETVVQQQLALADEAALALLLAEIEQLSADDSLSVLGQQPSMNEGSDNE